MSANGPSLGAGDGNSTSVENGFHAAEVEKDVDVPESVEQVIGMYYVQIVSYICCSRCS